MLREGLSDVQKQTTRLAQKVTGGGVRDRAMAQGAQGGAQTSPLPGCGELTQTTASMLSWEAEPAHLGREVGCGGTEGAGLVLHSSELPERG